MRPADPTYARENRGFASISPEHLLPVSFVWDKSPRWRCRSPPKLIVHFSRVRLPLTRLQEGQKCLSRLNPPGKLLSFSALAL